MHDNMAKIHEIKIETILTGYSVSDYVSGEGQYENAIGIDPELPVTDSKRKPSALIRPSAMAKFSDTEITGVPMWILPNPKTTSTYLYANDGKVHTIDDDLTMGTALNSGTALTASSGNGGEYYDNYIYLPKNTDIARYGPLNGTPTLTQDYWTSTLSLSALTDTTYPSINGVEMPNHVAYRHPNDNKTYVADVVGNQGVLHFIKTLKTTVEGDTNDGSTFNAIDFPLGYWPTAITHLGTSLIVGLIEGVSTAIKQKPFALAVWDTTSESFDIINQREHDDPLVTALLNVNGTIFVWSGSALGGCRISVLIGTSSLQELAYLPDTYPPLQGAVDHAFNRIIFGGSNIVDSTNYGTVWAFGSKYRNLGMQIHNIIKATAAGANPWVTALKYLEQTSKGVRPIIGWDDDSGKGLDKYSTTYGTSIFRTERYRVGEKFQGKRVRIPLAQAIAANQTIVVKALIDDGSSTITLGTINSTNFPSSERFVEFTTEFNGKNNFQIELTFSGTVLAVVGLPIGIKFETFDS